MPGAPRKPWSERFSFDLAEVVELVLPRLSQVQSPRSVEVLTEVGSDMRRRKRNSRINDVLPDLESALQRQPRIAA